MTAATGGPSRPVELTVARVEQLLACGQAQPLLAGYLPVPVLLGGQWWHLPRGPGALYRPAPPDLAALFTRRHAQLAAAAAAVRATDAHRHAHRNQAYS